MKAQIKPRINLENRTPLQTLLPLATPLVVFVDPSSACNFKCVFCPTGHPDLIKETGRYQGVMKFDVFCKIVDDFAEFDRPVRVLRLYKDGEPFLNKRLADMVAYAKGKVEYIDTTTNGALMTPKRLGPVLEAGIDRINVSVEGLDTPAYQSIAGVDYDPAKLIDNVKWLYANKGHCEVAVKIVGLPREKHQQFFDTYGNHCDRIYVENFAPCWPEFDPGVEITTGLYGQEPKRVEVCPYIFYAISVNADGLVSACFQDWKRELIVGDVRKQSLRAIWHSNDMNSLRMLHLDGRRCDEELCRDCGQLTHCMAEDLGPYREELLAKFKRAA